MKTRPFDLSAQFTRINMILGILVAILGITAFGLNTLLTEHFQYYDISEEDLQTIYESISSGNREIDWEALNVPDVSYAEILNEEYEILASSEGGKLPNFQYSVRVFNEVVGSPNIDVLIYYPYEDDREMLVMFMPFRDLIIPYQANLISLALFSLGLFAIVRSISRFSAKQIIHPIEDLSTAVHTIREGAYGKTIDLQAGNDLDRLADDINQLSLGISSEIEAREQLESSRQQLILDISHDLKTPLTNIIGYSESLSVSSNLSDSDRSFLSAIQRNGKRANQLLGDLFAYSKLNATEYSLDLQEFDIRYVMEEFIASRIPDIEKANKSFDVNLDDMYSAEMESSVMTLLDIQSFRRVLDNLVNNFIYHSGDDTTITFGMHIHNRYAVIDISDDGIGIPEEHRDHIFSAFYRMDKSRSSATGGSGLGLSITQKLVELHKGDISLIPSEVGTHFQIKVPLVDRTS